MCYPSLTNQSILSVPAREGDWAAEAIGVPRLGLRAFRKWGYYENHLFSPSKWVFVKRPYKLCIIMGRVLKLSDRSLHILLLNWLADVRARLWKGLCSAEINAPTERWSVAPGYRQAHKLHRFKVKRWPSPQ